MSKDKQPKFITHAGGGNGGIINESSESRRYAVMKTPSIGMSTSLPDNDENFQAFIDKITKTIATAYRIPVGMLKAPMTIVIADLKKDCEALAAGACIVKGGLVGDDGGTTHCVLQKKCNDYALANGALRNQISRAKACLVCAAIADPMEVCNNTLDILDEVNDD